MIKKCPKCNYPLTKQDQNKYYCKNCNTNHTSCEVFSRVVGYIRPVEAWNDGKQEEFKDRKTFNTNKQTTLQTRGKQ